MISGCAITKTEYIYVQPECIVPVQPALPTLPAIVIYESLGKESFLILQEREEKLVTWALDMETILTTICNNEHPQ